MSEGDRDETWDDWLPHPDDPDAERFKWGWNAAHGEVVWQVSGPADGLPAHAEQLRTAWGREPDASAGDVLGIATYVPSHSAEPAVVIQGYYGVPVPDGVVHWFQEAFPGVEVQGVGHP